MAMTVRHKLVCIQAHHMLLCGCLGMLCGVLAHANPQASENVSTAEMQMIAAGFLGRQKDIPVIVHAEEDVMPVLSMSSELGSQMDRLTHPDSAMPYWFLPPSSSLKILLTAIVFGILSLKTSAPKQKSRFSRLISMFCSVLFIVLALNSWFHDVTAFLADPTLMSGMVIWISSSNLPSACVIWAAVYEFSPQQVFTHLTPKYPNILGVPLIPGGTAWLLWDKHVYAILLAPYWVPFKLLNARISPFKSLKSKLSEYGTNAITCGYNMLCCACGISFCKPLCCCCGWAVLTALTLFLWRPAQQNTGIYWQQGAWTVMMFLGILLCTSLSILFACFAFALCSRGSLSWQVALQCFGKAFALQSSGDKNMQYKLFMAVYKFQDLSDFNVDEHSLDNRPILEEDEAKAILTLKCYALYSRTNDVVISILMGQLVLIVLGHMIVDRKSFFDAFKATMEERHISSYVHGIKELATSATSRAVNAMWLLI